MGQFPPRQKSDGLSLDNGLAEMQEGQPR